MGCSFNQGKRTLVVHSIREKNLGSFIQIKVVCSIRTWLVRSIRGKELGSFIQSGEKNLGRSFNNGKRTWVVRPIRVKEFVCLFIIRGKELGLFVQ